MSAATIPTTPAVPPLRHGERLSREEFERRYAATPEKFKAEPFPAQRNGAREYILWRVDDRAIDWHVLHGATYQLLPVGEDGVVRSETFPGLWLDIEAMIRGDMGSVLRALQRGLASPEHNAFVRQLKGPAGGNT